MLCLPPEDCLVVEDAVSGAQAGHAGGFQVACLGGAATAQAGEYNLVSFSQLLQEDSTLTRLDTVACHQELCAKKSARGQTFSTG